MVGLENVLKSDYSAYVIRTGYNNSSGRGDAGEDDKAVAVIRELVRGNIAGIRQSARDASTSISAIQIFTDAAERIGDKLAGMAELANRASSPDYSRVQVEEMQEEFRELAEEVNEIADNTSYDFNKLFSGEGQTLSLAMGNGEKVDVFARDFSLDAGRLDLTADPSDALAKIKDAMEEADEYGQCLDRQAGRLEEAMARLEMQYGEVLGIEVSDFDAIGFAELIYQMAEEAVDDESTLLDVQGNVSGVRARQLLEYKGTYTGDNSS